MCFKEYVYSVDLVAKIFTEREALWILRNYYWDLACVNNTANKSLQSEEIKMSKKSEGNAVGAVLQME